MPQPQPIITLTTDFGVNDHYIGVMKGVILRINPIAHIVDICNSVQSFDVLDGAITLSQCYNFFPADSIHLVVVDPGVGSARRPILVTTEKHVFIAPDNGVLSLVYDREERISVREITAEHYFLQPVSHTFHGRDIFAAVAGYLSKGVEAAKFGEEITEYVRFAAPRPKQAGEGLYKGVVLRVDKFGNLLTNITPKDIPQLFEPDAPPFRITVGKGEVTKITTSYADAPPGTVIGIYGSTGFLEVAANRGSAARTIGAEKGTEVTVQLNAPAS